MSLISKLARVLANHSPRVGALSVNVGVRGHFAFPVALKQVLAIRFGQRVLALPVLSGKRQACSQ
jgi:hypothetical protein